MTGIPVIGITTDLDEFYLRVKHGYCESVAEAGGVPVLLPPSGSASAYARMIDGLLIPGGDDLDPHYYGEDMDPGVNAVPRKRSDFEFSLLDEVVRLHKPVLGICYGMQLLNVFLGGTLYQEIEGMRASGIDHKDSHTVIVGQNKFVKSGEHVVNSTHHQAVKTLGKGLSVLARSPDGLIEAFYKEGYNFFIGIQWHPERLRDSEFSLGLFKSYIKASLEYE